MHDVCCCLLGLNLQSGLKGKDFPLNTKFEIPINYCWVNDGSQLTHEDFVPFHVLFYFA